MKKNTFELRLCGIFVVIMFLIYPLFSRGNYFNITETKWTFLCVITAIFLVLWGCSRVTDGKWIERNDYQRVLDLFLLLVLFSSIVSPYGKAAWTGASGRYTGAVFMCLEIAVCMCLGSSDWKSCFRKLFPVIGGSGMIVGIWAVMNFLGIDLFGMHQGMVEHQVRKFMAGIGNIVFVGSFFAIIIPMMFVLFLRTKKEEGRFIYGASLLISTLGLFVCGTDSGVISVFCLLFLILPGFTRNMEELKKYIFGMGIVMASGILAESMQPFCSYGNEAFDQVLHLLFSFYGFWIGLLVCLVLEIALHFWGNHWKLPSLKGIYYIGFCIGLILLVVLQEDVQNMLRFGENFGTDRGDMWIKALEIFRKEPVFRKMFGNGGDTFSMLLVKYIGSDMGINGMKFDNVHCEYLQYLLSYGLAGLGLYLYLMLRIVIQLFRDSTNMWKAVISAGMCGYLIQAGMGLNQVFTTPLFFVLCGMGITLLRPEVPIVKKKK